MITIESVTYGKPALVRLEAVVDELKAGDPMATVTILVPNQAAGTTAGRHLARAGGVAAVHVTTLRRYAEVLAGHRMGGRRPATRAIKASAWRHALSAAPGMFADVAAHPATIQALARAHDELRDVSDASLEVIAGQSPLTQDFVRLHREVTGDLSVNWYDDVDLLREAALAAPAGIKTVLFLPQRLLHAEQTMLLALAARGTVHVIAGLTGEARADGVVVDALRALGPVPPSTVAPVTSTQVLTASDSDDEARCVVRAVVEELSVRPAHRVAVLYAQASPYARLLHEHFAEAGIATNGPGTRPVSERAIVRALLAILNLVDRDLPRADLFHALSAASTRDFTGAWIPVSRWERASRAAAVVKGDDWDGRLERFAELSLEKDRAWDAETAHSLREFAIELRARFCQARSLTTWQELSAWALELCAALLGTESDWARLPDEEKYAATTLVSTLRGLAVLDQVDQGASVIALREMVEAELNQALPRVGRFGDGVLVAPVSAAIGLDLDVVFVVGLSEDLYPGTSHDDPLLPQRVRALVPQELTSLRDRVDEKHRLLLAALASADRSVVSFPRGDLRRTTERLPSRWLLPSLRTFANDAQLTATKWADAEYVDGVWHAGSFADELIRSAQLATEQEWRVRAAVAETLRDEVAASAEELRASRDSEDFTRFDGNLIGAAGLPDYAAGKIAVSPTALELYVSCPHAFFVQYVLGVRPIENPEDIVKIPASEIGNFIHECMDELVKAFPDALPGEGEPWTSEHRTRLMEIADAKTIDYEARGVTGHDRLWAGERAKLLATLNEMLDLDDAWRSANGARVLAAELSFGQKGDVLRPVAVPVPGGSVLMKGSADKVDVSGTRLYVTDIKSGKRDPFNKITQAQPTHGGSKLQLPVYGYAAHAAHGVDLPVTAAYWFVHRDSGRIEVELTDEVRATYGAQLGLLAESIAGGLFPSRPPKEKDFAFTQCVFCNPDRIGYRSALGQVAKGDQPALDRLVGLLDRGEVSDGHE